MSDRSARISLVDADDAMLANRASDGDIRAFEMIIRRHSPLMKAYARKILGSSDEVDDVVQETFITAWQQLPTLEEMVALRSWLMKIVSRKSIDRIRTRKQHANADDHETPAPEDTGPSEKAEATSREKALSNVLAGLPQEQRQCWALKHLADYSYDEIAAELDLPVSTVRGLLSRARKNVIQGMEGWR